MQHKVAWPQRRGEPLASLRWAVQLSLGARPATRQDFLIAMDSAAASNGRFHSTRWSVVLMAARANEPGAREALEELAHKYWYPICAFLRRQGRSPHDAEGLTQGFFGDLPACDWLRGRVFEEGKVSQLPARLRAQPPQPRSGTGTRLHTREEA